MKPPTAARVRCGWLDICEDAELDDDPDNPDCLLLLVGVEDEPFSD